MPWAKGQSGNPSGRKSGIRNKLTDRFIRDLDRDWRQNGAQAIVACRETHPEQYVAIVAKLLPKETQIDVRHDLSERFISAIRNAALPTTSSPPTIIDVTAQPVDEAKSLIALETQRNKDIP